MFIVLLLLIIIIIVIIAIYYRKVAKTCKPCALVNPYYERRHAVFRGNHLSSATCITRFLQKLRKA